MKTLHKSLASQNERILIDFQAENSFQENLFNSCHGDYCYMPLHVYEGLSGKLITTVLRPGKRPAGKEALSYLSGEVSLRLSRAASACPFRRFAGGRFPT